MPADLRKVANKIGQTKQSKGKTTSYATNRHKFSGPNNNPKSSQEGC